MTGLSVAAASNGPAGAVSDVFGALGGVIGLLQGAVRLFTDTGHFIQDAVGWVTNALFPAELQTWFLGSIGEPGQQWDPTHIYEATYHAVQGPGLVLAGAAASARIVRAAVDHRAGSLHVVLDVVPRLAVVVLVIGIPSTQVSVGYTAIVWAVNASMLIARELFQAIFHASLLQGIHPGEGWFSHLYGVIASAGRSVVAVVVGGIPLLILLLYACFLMVVRTVMIGFCIATAPLCLASLAFDGGQNRLFKWWGDLLVGAALTPIIFALSIGLSITLASSIVSAAVIGPILAFITICGGLWMSAKLVNTITWGHFTHGGALAGFAAGVSTLLAPMHHVGTVALMTEALSSKGSQSGHPLHFLKRMGIAAHGLHQTAAPASFDSPHRQASVTSAGIAREHEISVAPDMVASLSTAGRTAVAGAESVFSRAAFRHFQKTQSRLVGELTTDVAFGTVSQADRTRLAWDRYGSDAQQRFVDDFLPDWLGAADTPLTHRVVAGALEPVTA